MNQETSEYDPIFQKEVRGVVIGERNTEHLELRNYKISGYWDEQDKFHEEIILPRSLSAELVNSSLGIADKKRWIQLKFILKAEAIATGNLPSNNYLDQLGELTITYDEDLQFIDEHWYINC
ncbi:MAG: hypothetical protein HC916_17730 [Coleofasciculaceae cyanobacterium SM2_1_6]|nr:hypothetical protein [Coleofasciculaceae cyanobacterium SM2_1_6]